MSYIDTARGKVKLDARKHQARIKEIIADSLYGADIDHITILTGNRVKVIYSAYPGDDATSEEYLEYNYGDGAPDGWMEGDIYIKDDIELGLDFVQFQEL